MMNAAGCDEARYQEAQSVRTACMCLVCEPLRYRPFPLQHNSKLSMDWVRDDLLISEKDYSVLKFGSKPSSLISIAEGHEVCLSSAASPEDGFPPARDRTGYRYSPLLITVCSYTEQQFHHNLRDPHLWRRLESMVEDSMYRHVP